MSLRLTDLNLVPVLQLLLRERSVSRAAEMLGLSQPAVSAALRRLRTLFDDTLLVRVGSGMELTPRAVALASDVDAVCAQLSALLARPVFDAATSTRVFTVAAPDHTSFLLGSTWLDTLARVAPGTRLRFIDLREDTAQGLARREIDFALMPSFFVEDLPAAPLRFHPLFKDGSVAMFARGHALAAIRKLALSDLMPYRGIVFHPGFGRIERRHSGAMLGYQQFDLIAEVPQLELIPFLLLDTDFFGITSQRMADRLCNLLPLEWRAFDFPTEEVDVGLAWSHVQESDPAHLWFRQVVAGAAP